MGKSAIETVPGGHGVDGLHGKSGQMYLRCGGGKKQAFGTQFENNGFSPQLMQSARCRLAAWPVFGPDLRQRLGFTLIGGKNVGELIGI